MPASGRHRQDQPPRVPRRGHRWLLAIAALLAVCTAVVYWPHAAPRVDLPPPLPAARLAALDDEALVAAQVRELSARLVRAGSRPDGWKTLPEPARNLWLAAALAPQIAEQGFLDYLLKRQDGAPGLGEIRAALTAVGGSAAAAVFAEAEHLAAGEGASAVAACQAYAADQHAPSFVRPPGFSDPFAALGGRLVAALPALAAAVRGYARGHLSGIAPDEVTRSGSATSAPRSGG